MLFNSLDFLLFFPIVTISYYLMPRKVRYIWLLVCSYYFYMSWNPKYAILIIISTVTTFLGGALLDRAVLNNAKELVKRLIVASVIVINIGILAYFKYANFFIEIISDVFAKIGVCILIPKVDVLLPVGISFYTFQALSYTLDIYRGEIRAERNPFKYALFVSFFPQLVAGPIERSKNLLSNIENMENVKVDLKRVYYGLLLMLWGLFLKMVIADRIAVLVNCVFEQHYLYGGIVLFVAAVAFAIQIYCDFSSYSIIAIGAAETLGCSLMENFNAPYLAVSIKDFWRRWHISLSTWFRDYVYIPLGGTNVLTHGDMLI